MDTIQFFIVEFINEVLDVHHSEIHIYINRRNLIDLVQQVEGPALNLRDERNSSGRSYAGLNPEWRPNLRNEFLGRTDYPYSAVLTCTCHEDWCNSVLAKIEVTSQTVTWKDFTSVLHGEESRSWGGTPIDYSSLGPFVFEREQYLDALNDVGLNE